MDREQPRIPDVQVVGCAPRRDARSRYLRLRDRQPWQRRRNIVLVRSVATNQPKFMGFTNRVDRPRGGAAVHVTLGEAVRGQPSPIVAWYPMDDSTGRQFIRRQ